MVPASPAPAPHTRAEEAARAVGGGGWAAQWPGGATAKTPLLLLLLLLLMAENTLPPGLPPTRKAPARIAPTRNAAPASPASGEDTAGVGESSPPLLLPLLRGAAAASDRASRLPPSSRELSRTDSAVGVEGAEDGAVVAASAPGAPPPASPDVTASPRPTRR